MKTMKTVLFAVLMVPMFALADKIAVVDPMQAIIETEEVKSRNATLESSLEADSQRLRRLRDDITKVEERLQRDGMTMSSEERNRLTDERETKGFEFQSLQQSLQRRVNSDRQALIEQMEPKVLRAIEEISKEMDLDLVISAQAAVFAKPDLDITAQVTQRINRMK